MFYGTRGRFNTRQGTDRAIISHIKATLEPFRRQHQETPERRGGAHKGFTEHADTILNWTQVNKYSRTAKKSTSHGSEVPSQDAMHLIRKKKNLTNEEVRAKIQQAIAQHEDLLTIVKRRKLQWYGHVSCSSGLAKTILQGTMKEGRRQGRQKKRGGKTASGNEQALSSPSPRGQWRREKNGENWLWSHPWCPNDPRS